MVIRAETDESVKQSLMLRIPVAEGSETGRADSRTKRTARRLYAVPACRSGQTAGFVGRVPTDAPTREKTGWDDKRQIGTGCTNWFHIGMSFLQTGTIRYGMDAFRALQVLFPAHGALDYQGFFLCSIPVPQYTLCRFSQYKCSVAKSCISLSDAIF